MAYIGGHAIQLNRIKCYCGPVLRAWVRMLNKHQRMVPHLTNARYRPRVSPPHLTNSLSLLLINLAPLDLPLIYPRQSKYRASPRELCQGAVVRLQGPRVRVRSPMGSLDGPNRSLPLPFPPPAASWYVPRSCSHRMGHVNRA